MHAELLVSQDWRRVLWQLARASSKAWIPELIAAAGAEVTETYIGFFTSTIRNRNTRAAYARAYGHHHARNAGADDRYKECSGSFRLVPCPIADGESAPTARTQFCPRAAR
jgi:hypothetical protein